MGKFHKVVLSSIFHRTSHNIFKNLHFPYLFTTTWGFYKLVNSLFSRSFALPHIRGEKPEHFQKLPPSLPLSKIFVFNDSERRRRGSEMFCFRFDRRWRNTVNAAVTGESVNRRRHKGRTGSIMAVQSNTTFPQEEVDCGEITEKIELEGNYISLMMDLCLFLLLTPPLRTFIHL